jgi:prepilin-type N-terminal cleavage/methylation domain-containing protein
MFRQQLRDARDEGFTLIELLIVIVVLGILGGIVVFGVSTFRADSVSAACKVDLKTVQVASEAYNAKFGRVATGIGIVGDPVGDPGTLVGNGYLKAPPVTVIAWNSGAPTATC